MKLHKGMIQGSPEWQALRAEHLCASDAPAMMGQGKYKSRNQLLEELATGVVAEVTPEKQALFDRGHEAEAAARDSLEFETLTSYPPVVGTREVEGLPLLASFDGFSEELQDIFEHKLWNETLAENVRNNVLEPEYYWQLEHQLLVADPLADAVTFVTSDGTIERREMLAYTSVPERRATLIAGWKRFHQDLAAWTPKAKQEVVVGAEVDGFPLVQYRVEGSRIVSNIKEVLPAIQQRAAEEMARPLETDQDFADKENMNKAVKEARQKIKDAVETVKGEFVSYADFASTADQIDAVLQKLQSHGEKAVKTAKEQKKQDIARGIEASLQGYIQEVNHKIAPLNIAKIMTIRPNFAGAMKNKRTLESLQNAVDDELNRVKIEIDQVVKTVIDNMDWYHTFDVDYSYLFRDMDSIVNQGHEGFKAIVQQRISEQERIEKERREREEKNKQEQREREEAAQEAKAKAASEQPAAKEEPPPATATTPTIATPRTPGRRLDAIEAWAQRHNVSDEALSELMNILEAKAA